MNLVLSHRGSRSRIKGSVGEPVAASSQGRQETEKAPCVGRSLDWKKPTKKEKEKERERERKERERENDREREKERETTTTTTATKCRRQPCLEKSAEIEKELQNTPKKHKKLQDEKCYSREVWVAVFAVRMKRETKSKANKNP